MKERTVSSGHGLQVDAEKLNVLSQSTIEGLAILLDDYRVPIKLAAVRNNLPAVYSQSDFVRDGGLLYYGVDPADLWRRAASYVEPHRARRLHIETLRIGTAEQRRIATALKGPAGGESGRTKKLTGKANDGRSRNVNSPPPPRERVAGDRSDRLLLCPRP
jgi:hypothetical protein